MLNSAADQKGKAGYIYITENENLQPRLLYLARISFKIDVEIKDFQTSKR